MGEIHRAGVGNAADVRMSVLRDDDLADGVIEVVTVVAGDAVGFRFIPLQDDDAVVPVSLRGHDDGNDLAQEIVALLDVGRIAGEPFVASAQGGVQYRCTGLA